MNTHFHTKQDKWTLKQEEQKKKKNIKQRMKIKTAYLFVNNVLLHLINQKNLINLKKKHKLQFLGVNFQKLNCICIYLMSIAICVPSNTSS